MWFLDRALPAFALVTSLLAAQPPLGGSPGKPQLGKFFGKFLLKVLSESGSIDFWRAIKNMTLKVTTLSINNLFFSFRVLEKHVPPHKLPFKMSFPILFFFWASSSSLPKVSPD